MENDTQFTRKKTTANVVFGQKSQLPRPIDLLFYKQRQFFSISPSFLFHDALAVLYLESGWVHQALISTSLDR
jgi:hypothetical protein